MGFWHRVYAWARVYMVLSSLERERQLDKIPRNLITHQKQ